MLEGISAVYSNLPLKAVRLACTALSKLDVKLSKDGDSTFSLGNLTCLLGSLFQLLTAHIVKLFPLYPPGITLAAARSCYILLFLIIMLLSCAFEESLPS